MPRRRTFRNTTYQAWAIWHLSNDDLFWIIPDPGSQQRVTLLRESICKILFHARASDVKMPKLRKHSSNCGMPCFMNVFRTVQGTWDLADHNQGILFRCAAHIFLNITNCEMQPPDMLIARKIGHVSLVGCTYNWYNCRFSRKWILCIPPPIACVDPAVDLRTLRVSVVHCFKIEVHLKWEMYQKEVDTFENITVV